MTAAANFIKPSHGPTSVQLAILVALSKGKRHIARIRWHSYIFGPKGKYGRGELLFAPSWEGKLVADYTVRALIKQNLIKPVDDPNREPFNMHGNPYRDYDLTERGRRMVEKHTNRSDLCCEKATAEAPVCEDCAETSAAYSKDMGPNANG